MIAMMREERGEEVERIERQLHERARHLRYAHRWDEFQVFQAEIEKVFQRVREFEEIRERLEEEEEREDERREREHDDDDPPRAGEL
jgi:hypothetical protein